MIVETTLFESVVSQALKFHHEWLTFIFLELDFFFFEKIRRARLKTGYYFSLFYISFIDHLSSYLESIAEIILEAISGIFLSYFTNFQRSLLRCIMKAITTIDWRYLIFLVTNDLSKILKSEWFSFQFLSWIVIRSNLFGKSYLDSFPVWSIWQTTWSYQMNWQYRCNCISKNLTESITTRRSTVNMYLKFTNIYIYIFLCISVIEKTRCVSLPKFIW